MNFDRVAPHYRWLEAIAFGNALQSARVACFSNISNPVRALVVGEGNGRFICELLKLHPQVKIDCLDSSRRMLQLAHARVGRELPNREHQVRFLQEDLRSCLLEENAYDLVVTHFVLDCFTQKELRVVTGKIGRAARATASWLLADFALPSSGMARFHAQLWLRVMYRFFRVTAQISATGLVDPSRFLCAQGFHLSTESITRFGLIKSEHWERGSALA